MHQSETRKCTKSTAFSPQKILKSVPLQSRGLLLYFQHGQVYLGAACKSLKRKGVIAMKDYFGYQGKVCVITGASSGIGRSTAEILVELGAEVYALNRRDCGIPGLAGFIPTDLSDRASIDRAFAQLPERIDRFFGVSGLSGVQSDYMTTFNVNYTANRYICETYLKTRMAHGGAILLVTSSAGIGWVPNLEEMEPILALNDWDAIQAKVQEMVPEDTDAHLGYALSKRLANVYSARLAIELAPQGIRVNALLPGSTDTGMRDEFALLCGGLDNMIKFAGLAGRLARSEEMGMPAVFANSDMASFMSGEELVIDCCDNAMRKLSMKPDYFSAPIFAK